MRSKEECGAPNRCPMLCCEGVTPGTAPGARSGTGPRLAGPPAPGPATGANWTPWPPSPPPAIARAGEGRVGLFEAEENCLDNAVSGLNVVSAEELPGQLNPDEIQCHARLGSPTSLLIINIGVIFFCRDLRPGESSGPGRQLRGAHLHDQQWGHVHCLFHGSDKALVICRALYLKRLGGPPGRELLRGGQVLRVGELRRRPLPPRPRQWRLVRFLLSQRPLS